MPEGLLLLFFRHCSGRAPGYFTVIGDKAPPAARYIEVRLHVLKTGVVILSAETVGPYWYSLLLEAAFTRAG